MAEEIRQADRENNLTLQPEAKCLASEPVVSRGNRADRLSFGATALIAFAVYFSTLPPNMTLEWSGILSASANYAAVSPPPGYPVWTIYSWLFVKLLPFSNIARRVAVGSAVATATACGLIALMVSRWATILFSKTPAFTHRKPIERDWLRGVSGCVAGLLLGFSKVVWEMAVVADIWALSLLLFVGVLALVAQWMLYPARRWPLLAAFFLFGLLLTSSQQMIVALPGVVCAIMLADCKLGRDLAILVLPLATLATLGNQYAPCRFHDHLNWPIWVGFISMCVVGGVLIVYTRRVGTEWKPALLCVLGLLLGLAAYLYVPIASMSNPPVNWGYPRTAEGFLHVISRGQFERVHPTIDPGVFGTQLVQFASGLPRAVGWSCVLFVASSLCSIFRMSRPGFRWLLGLLAVWICVGPLMVGELNPPPDRQAQELVELYFASAHAILALWAGVGMIWLGASLSRARDDEPCPVHALPRAE